MWIERTPEEVAKCQKDTEKRARTNGLMIGLMVWGLTLVCMSSVWLVSFSTGMAIQRGSGGDFWSRLPLYAVLASPIILIARRYETKKALRNAEAITICPQCDTIGSNNSGANYQYGGTFVLSKAMKWVE